MSDWQPASEEYDDSPWTNEEMDLLAAENTDLLGWEGFDEYQNELDQSD